MTGDRALGSLICLSPVPADAGKHGPWLARTVTRCTSFDDGRKAISKK